MHFLTNSATEKNLRKLWLGNFDLCRNSWVFSGSPYPTKVGSMFGNALAFDGDSSLSSSFNLNSKSLAIYFFFTPFLLNDCSLLSLTSANRTISLSLANSKLLISYDSASSSSESISINSTYFLALTFADYTASNGFRFSNLYAFLNEVDFSNYLFRHFNTFNEKFALTLGDGFTGSISQFCIQQNTSSYAVPSQPFSKNSNTISLLQFVY